MTPEKDEWFKKAQDNCVNDDCWSECPSCKATADALRSAYKLGRESMREEAAKIAEDHDAICDGKDCVFEVGNGREYEDCYGEPIAGLIWGIEA